MVIKIIIEDDSLEQLKELTKKDLITFLSKMPLDKLSNINIKDFDDSSFEDNDVVIYNTYTNIINTKLEDYSITKLEELKKEEMQNVFKKIVQKTIKQKKNK